MIIARAAKDQRRRDQFLLRVRGASLPQIVRLSSVEAIFQGTVGAGFGILAAEGTARALFGAGVFTMATLWWSILSAALGVSLALVAVLLPAWQDARHLTTQAEGRPISPRSMPPLWQRAWLDALLIVIGAGFYWRSAATGYQVVLAPEGVAATAVDYTAFLAPLLIAVGLGLATLRLDRKSVV